jgi:hypothetical protein
MRLSSWTAVASAARHRFCTNEALSDSPPATCARKRRRRSHSAGALQNRPSRNEIRKTVPIRLHLIFVIAKHRAPSRRAPLPRGIRNAFVLAIAACQSARGLAHSKTLRVRRTAPDIRQVLDCGGPPPLFPGSIAQSVFIRVNPWSKIQTPFVPIVHPKMNSGKESVTNAEFGMRIVECSTRPSSA